MQDDARHKAAHAAKQAEIGKEAILEHACKAHSSPTNTRSKTDEYPHHQNDVLVKGAVVGALIVLVQEVHHQRRANKRYTRP